MTRKDLLKYDPDQSNRELARLNRKPANRREVLMSGIECAVYLALITGLFFVADWVWTWIRNQPSEELLGDALLMVAMLFTVGVVWCLFVATAETLGVVAWMAITWCGYAVGAALGGWVVGIAGAILIGVSLAPFVAHVVYSIASEICD